MLTLRAQDQGVRGVSDSLPLPSRRSIPVGLSGAFDVPRQLLEEIALKSLILLPFSRTAPLRPLPSCAKFRRRMSRFPARCCVKGYENILFRKKETPARAGGNHPDRPGNIHPTVCTNHYHL